MWNRSACNVAVRWMSERVVLWAITAVVLTGAQPAEAQWRNYYGYQAYPAYPPYAYPGYPQYPPYGTSVYDDPPPRAYRRRPYPDQSYIPDYDNPYAPRGTVRRGPGDPASLGLGVDPRQATAQVVAYGTREPPGTIVVDTQSRHLYLVQAGGRAIQYGIGVGRQGFEWKGIAHVGRKSEWPRWIPPKEMLKRRPDLPEEMDGGLENPLGARALYLFQGSKDTLFRIHGTNEPNTIGQAVSSGCIRMMNADAIDLYGRVSVGTRVVVL